MDIFIIPILEICSFPFVLAGLLFAVVSRVLFSIASAITPIPENRKRLNETIQAIDDGVL